MAYRKKMNLNQESNVKAAEVRNSTVYSPIDRVFQISSHPNRQYNRLNPKPLEDTIIEDGLFLP